MARLVAPLALALFFASPIATAQVASDEDVWDGGFDVVNERRSDFTMGVGLGLAMGESHGVMNEVKELNDDSFEHSTGFALGNDVAVWLGGAILDWFAVSVGVGFGGSAGEDIVVDRQTYHLKLDVYPAYSLGGPWRDLGVQLDGGIGALTGFDADDTDEKVFEGGSVSALGIGTFWEGWRFAKGRFGSGPFLHYRLLRGLPSTSHTVTLGMRLSYYSGPKRKKKSDPAKATASPSPSFLPVSF